MKKNFFLFTILLFAAMSCERNESDINALADKTQVGISQTATREYVVTKADIQNYLKSFRGINLNLSTKASAEVEITPLLYKGDTVMYALNYEKGYDLISADKRAPIVLATSEEGLFDEKKLNPSEAFWISEYKDIIRLLKSTKTTKTTGSNMMNTWYAIDKTYHKTSSPVMKEDGYTWWLVNITEASFPINDTGHLMPTHWAQSSSWNSVCPYSQGTTTRCVAGCVAIAGAQVVRYLHYFLGVPTQTYSTGSCTGYATYSLINGILIPNGYTFSFSNPTSTIWDEMGLDNSSPQSAQAKAAILIGYTGQQVNMHYGLESSSATFGNLTSYLDGVGLSSDYYTSFNFSTAVSNLTSSLPVLIAGFTTQSEENGHAWVMDGYRKYRDEYTYEYRYLPVDSGYWTDEIYNNAQQRFEYETSYREYVLMNWGFGNTDNTYYLPTQNWSDPVTGNAFPYNHKMIANIRIKEN